jgi:hypothetical protein
VEQDPPQLRDCPLLAKPHRSEAVIPTRDSPNESAQRREPNFDKTTYRRWTIIERCIGWMKESDPIVTRLEKLAMIDRYFRLLSSDGV